MSKIAKNLQILEQTANQYWNIAVPFVIIVMPPAPPLNIPTRTLALILAAHATTVFRNE